MPNTRPINLSWVVPAAILALMPKCPVCFAGYFVAISGIGLSLTTATALRWALIATCVSSLVYLAYKTFRDGDSCCCGHNIEETPLHTTFIYPENRRS